MVDQQTALYTVVGVSVIILLIITYNNMRARQERESGPDVTADDDDASVSPMLSRFVRHDGNVVGETVAIENGQLILKQAGVFKSVPKSSATLVEDEVVLSGHVDWDQAIEAGSLWKTGNTKGVDPQVTSDLTKSEDIRKPALEALKEKQGDAEATPEPESSSDAESEPSESSSDAEPEPSESSSDAEPEPSEAPKAKPADGQDAQEAPEAPGAEDSEE